MTFEKGDVILYPKVGKNWIGYIQDSAPASPFCVVSVWQKISGASCGNVRILKKDLLPFSGQLTSLPRNVRDSLIQFYWREDPPVIRKIKELDFKWECLMKERGGFYLTSRV